VILDSADGGDVFSSMTHTLRVGSWWSMLLSLHSIFVMMIGGSAPFSYMD
jgi:hypothetical protein